MKAYCWFKLFSILVLLICLPFYNRAQIAVNKGDKLIDFFPPSSYKGDIQAWDTKSGNNGYVFFASGEGLSVYDGIRWFSPQSYGNKPYDLRALFFDTQTNILYSAGDNEFGYWKTDQFGQFIYTRIFFNDKADNPKMFWRIGRSNQYIYFGAKEAIFRYNPQTQQIDNINTNTAFHFMYIADNEIYVQRQDTLYLLDNMKMKATPYCFEDRITAIFKDSASNNLLFFREDKGIFTLSEDGSLKELNKETNRIIGKNRLFSVSQASDGTYLLGTILGGLFQMDRNGNIFRNVNKKNGLPYVSVLSVTTDSYGNIWMGLEGGVAKMDNIPNESYIVDYNSDIGGVYAVYDDTDKLYIGTNKGVFIRDEKNNFSLLSNTQGQAWSITKIDNEIFACHDAGIFRIKGISAEPIYSREGVWSIAKIPFLSDSYISSNYHGFNLYKKINGKIINAGPLSDFKGEARVTAFDKHDYFWVMATGVGFYRFTFSEDLKSVTYKLSLLSDKNKNSVQIDLKQA